MLKIFYDGKWKAFQAPDKTKKWFNAVVVDKQAYAEARANALVVLNPEIIPWVGNDGYPIFQKVEGMEHDWPGTFIIEPMRKANCNFYEVIVLFLPNSDMVYSEGSEVPNLTRGRAKEEKEFTKRDIEIAFCCGLLNQSGFTMDMLSEQLKTAQNTIDMMVKGMRNGEYKPELAKKDLCEHCGQNHS